MLAVLVAVSGCGGIAIIDGTPAVAGGAGGAGGDATGGAGTGGGAGAPPTPLHVYANDATTLYGFDVDTQEVSVLGELQGCGSSLNELAIDQAGNVFGTTNHTLYAIDPKTASCQLIGTGTYPLALSFVPAGTVDPDEEALVGYLDDAYLRVDTKTGAVTDVGQLGGGFVASGDLVSVIGGKTYLTVMQGGCDDCLVQVDPASGEVVEVLGALGFSQVWGLAYWDGVAYGFTKTGQSFRIDFDSSGLVVTELSSNGAFSFWGAGSSTAAPL